MNKEILLSDSKYFEIGIGKRVTKKQVYGSKGKIPIYSSNVFKPFGYIDAWNLDDFEHDYVLWGIDGNFEFNIKHIGEKFGTTDHCGTIKILDQDIKPEYLSYQLDLKKHELGFDRSLRASLTNMETVSVSMPFTEEGIIDVKQQEAIVEKYTTIQEMKSQISSELEELENVEIELDGDSENMGEFCISDIFDFPETNSGITKDFCQNNKGTIPVYGCSKSENIALGYIKPDVNGVKYYEDCLTWNRNGSVGYFFLRKGKFATNEDHRTLKTKNSYLKQIHLPYVRYILQNSVKKLGYNFSNKLGKEKISTVTIQIPITDNGTIDLKQQEEIAEIYEKIYAVKKGLVDNLQIINESIIAI